MDRVHLANKIVICLLIICVPLTSTKRSYEIRVLNMYREAINEEYFETHLKMLKFNRTQVVFNGWALVKKDMTPEFKMESVFYEKNGNKYSESPFVHYRSSMCSWVGQPSFKKFVDFVKRLVKPKLQECYIKVGNYTLENGIPDENVGPSILPGSDYVRACFRGYGDPEYTELLIGYCFDVFIDRTISLRSKVKENVTLDKDEE